jgi:uncharacterized repeat protein (TIGR01451 family)
MKSRAFTLALASWQCCEALAATVDLGVVLSADPGPVSVSSNLVYTALVTNAGNNRATGIVVTNVLPPEITFVSASSSQGSCAYAEGSVICALGNLNGGESAVISIRTQPTVQGYLENSVSVRANQADENPENNTSSVITLVGLSDLALLINNPPEPVVAGQTVTYVLTITNLGPDPTAGYLFTRFISVGPDGYVLLSAQPSQGTVDLGSNFLDWNLASLAVQQSASLTLEIWILSDLGFRIESSVAPSPNAQIDIDLSNNMVSDNTSVASGSGVLQFAEVAQDVLESTGIATILVNRIGGALGTVRADFATQDRTALAGQDYVATGGTLTFTNGETQKSLPVNLLRGPELQCAREFTARLFNPGGGAMLGPKTNTAITLFKDDVVPAGITECISVTHTNPWVTAYGQNYPGFLSRDGRYVLFRSTAGTPVPNVEPGYYQVYLRDMILGITRLVSASRSLTGGGNADSDWAAMSGNGRYVAFESRATDLTTNSVTGNGDVFLRDMMVERTLLVTASTNGDVGGNDRSFLPLVSSNGLVVAFNSAATDLVTNCPCGGHENVFARNLGSNVTRLVSVSQSGIDAPNGNSRVADISADGRYVVFWSEASNLVGGDTNGQSDVFVRDLLMETTLLVSAGSTGTGNGSSEPQYLPRISANGRFVVFDSEASDLVPGDLNESRDVFVRDLVIGTTRLVSVNRFGDASANGYSEGTAMSPNGRYVAFTSSGTDVVADHTGPNNIFLRDLQAGTTVLVSVDCAGQAADQCGGPLVSDDGRYVVFNGYARDLVPGDFTFPSWTVPRLNIYRRDLVGGTTTLLSADYGLTGGGNEISAATMMSADGKAVLLLSSATDLTLTEDENSNADVFVWRELPPGINTELRVTSTSSCRASVMIVTLTVTNFGPDTATGVMVNDTLPSGAQFLTATATRGVCTISGSHVTCSVGTLSRRAGAVITIAATATTNGVVTHLADIAGDEPDPFQPNNSSASGTAMELPPSATLVIAHCNRQIFVNWLSAPADLQLECTSALGLAGSWLPVTSGIFDNGVLKTLIVTNGSPPVQFYRLRGP